MQCWLMQSGEIKLVYLSLHNENVLMLFSFRWWDTTGYFPGVPGKANPSTAQDDFDDANFPVSLHIDLDNSTNPTTVDFTGLLKEELTAFGVGAKDPDYDVSAPSSVTAQSPTPSPTPPPPPAADICGDWYRVFFDHFEVYGKNFDADKFGQDGSGLKKQIQGTCRANMPTFRAYSPIGIPFSCLSNVGFVAGPADTHFLFHPTGCGDLTKWSFEARTNDPQGYQWFAKGNLPIGTKGCVGRAVVSAGGASPDGCKGAG